MVGRDVTIYCTKSGMPLLISFRDIKKKVWTRHVRCLVLQNEHFKNGDLDVEKELDENGKSER
jgi:hypothetical protein